MFGVLIMAAGKGDRMQLQYNKIFLKLKDKFLFEIAIEKFKDLGIEEIILVVSKEDQEAFKKLNVKEKMIIGGKTRQESVRNGLREITSEYVLIHDAARPFTEISSIKQVMAETIKNQAAFLGKQVTDTIKMQKGNKIITLNRENLIQAETPQGFKTDLIRKCHELALKEFFICTDDCSLLEKYFPQIYMMPVIHAAQNNKITHQSDLDLFNKEEKFMYRIGHSWDIHKLVEGRKLILGGLHIEFEKGLLGHSDADCLYHAVSESLLGSLALGDLGSHFPDTKADYKNIDSGLLLSKCFKMISDRGYEVNNLDVMIYAEKPKMQEFIPLMRKNVASLLETDLENISIKATTTEKLGDIGEGKAIACEAVILIRKRK